MNHRPVVLLLVMMAQLVGAQTIGQRAASKYRNSVVFLSVDKITSTGAVVQEFGTGFIVSDKGHVLTSCHVVEKSLLESDGRVSSTIVDKVEIRGAMASRSATLEPVSMMRCAQGGYDLALLKFKNTAIRRVPIPVSVYSAPALGAQVASMGFPLNTEFFVRQGTIGGETDDDTLSLDLTLNPGDSGGPVLDDELRVVAVAEAGYGGGAHIGIARPIRHGSVLLTEAGVMLAAVNAAIPTTPLAGAPAQLNVETAGAKAASRIFASAPSQVPADAEVVKVTYAASEVFRAPPAPATSGPGSPTGISVLELQAKPGYRITDAKFIQTASDEAQVVNVAPTVAGRAARVTFKKVSPDKFELDKPAFVRGYVETVQQKIQ